MRTCPSLFLALASMATLATTATAASAQGAPSPAKRALASSIDAKYTHYASVANQIWNFAEVGYHETQSSALLQSELAKAGFKVESGVAGIPTAFVATFGTGQPVIGILAEFDALPGLSQQVSPERMKVLVAADPHSPAQIRASGTPTNMPTFAAAFGCKEGDAMVHTGSKLVTIW